jgi:glycosyltransferase involved in cell wall biosynthesis
MKILTINYTDVTQIGGVNYSIKRVSEELVKRGHECHVVSINPGNLQSEETMSGINIIRTKSPMSKYLYGFSPSLAWFLTGNLRKSLNPDIVHIHGYRTLLSPEVACIVRAKRLPFVFSPHYDRLGYDTFAGKYLTRWYKPLGSRTFNWAEKTIVNSEYTKQILLEDFDISLEKVEIIPHGVDKLEISQNKPKQATDTSISLLYVGVLTEKKCVNHIIQAVSEVKSQSRRVHLTIIGQGDREHELRELAEALDVESSVSWHQPLFGEELYRKFREADIFLILSRDESYGIVVAEALAAGTPCIVTKTTALTEFVTEPGCFGVDYPPDPKEVADLIIKIHDEEIKVGPFSDKIRTWDKVAVDYEKLYQQVLNSHEVGGEG